MVKVGKHVISARDISALVAPFAICIIITYALMRRLAYSGVLAACVIFMISFSPAIVMWLLRMRTHPDDPWKFRL